MQRNLIKATSGLASIMQMPSSGNASAHCLVIAEGLICIILFETQHSAPQTFYGQPAESH